MTQVRVRVNRSVSGFRKGQEKVVELNSLVQDLITRRFLSVLEVVEDVSGHENYMNYVAEVEAEEEVFVYDIEFLGEEE